MTKKSDAIQVLEKLSTLASKQAMIASSKSEAHALDMVRSAYETALAVVKSQNAAEVLSNILDKELANLK